MRRSLPLLLPVALFTACSSAPPRMEFLPPRSSFPTTYEGRIEPAVATVATFPRLPQGAMTATAPSDPPAEAATVRAWLVELPIVEARLLFGIGTSTAGNGYRVDRDALLQNVEAWHARGVVRSAPFATVNLGADATMTVTNQSAAIASFDLRQNVGGFILDPVVQNFEHGTAITVQARRDGDDVLLSFTWRQSDLLQPGTGASLDGVVGHMAVPVVMRQQLAGETKVAPRDAVVLGEMRTTKNDSLLVLCFEANVPAPEKVALAATAR